MIEDEGRKMSQEVENCREERCCAMVLSGKELPSRISEIPRTNPTSYMLHR